MAIFGILGGIGSGKTLAMVYLLFQDAVKHKKQILCNIRLDIPNYRPVSMQILEELGADLRGKSIGIDEIHNAMDSRDGQKKKVKKKTHFILQSRHAGEGSLDIYYTTQDRGQVDIRLRKNTDVWVYPSIIKRDEDNRPLYMIITYVFKLGQTLKQIDELVDIEPFTELYDTHEVVPLED